ncbi:hypothetical protein AG1IA_03509 [Rhizoctonia solani AG-1 IA]|uniref:Uncharacterized protein n=1 Tax=Thanatephorus cucumeris (strain AG1-IA) TaxID=983506 RepID=L8X1J4_THACA|nr:hypothetical protein AG1IA_03509 [Rhizoctonia solani AG-1 IA]
MVTCYLSHPWPTPSFWKWGDLDLRGWARGGMGEPTECAIQFQSYDGRVDRPLCWDHGTPTFLSPQMALFEQFDPTRGYIGHSICVSPELSCSSIIAGVAK